MKRKTLIILLSIFLLIAHCQHKSYALSDNAKETLLKTGGVFSGITISPFIGSIRGLAKGFKLGTDYTSEMLGNKEGSVHRMLGFGTGGIIGGVAGLSAGLLMGAHEGVRYGIESPFSKENFSLGGTSFIDYNLLD